MIDIREMEDAREKRDAARLILEALPDWFGNEEARENYIRASGDWRFLAACEDGRPIGFLCLKETGKATVEIAVMGVLPAYHRQGAGRRLVEKAKEKARLAGYHFMQVKTVRMGMYPDYDRTNLFYRSMGFEEMEVFPDLWDEQNPCQIYILAL